MLSRAQNPAAQGSIQVPESSPAPASLPYHPLTVDEYNKMCVSYQARRHLIAIALVDMAHKCGLLAVKQRDLDEEAAILKNGQRELDEQQEQLNCEWDHLEVYRRRLRCCNLVKRASKASAMLTAAKRKRDEYKPASFDDEPRSDLRKLLEAAREAHITEMETNMRNLQAHKDNIMTAIAEVYTK